MQRVCGARVALAVSVICAAVALGSGSAAAKNASKSTQAAAGKNQAAQLPVVPGSQYLALGDSVTFGYI
jgi:hypothetical protein